MDSDTLIGMLVSGSVFVLFLIISIVFLRGKGSKLIAGYNTLPKDEQEEYDSVKLCKFMGKAMLAVSASMLLLPIYLVTENNWLIVLFFVSVFGLSIFAVAYGNTGNRFKKIN